MSAIDDGGPAFPGNIHHSHELVQPFFGMTLRDYFAAKAMQYFLNEDHMCDQKDIADAAYSMADGMPKARGEE